MDLLSHTVATEGREAQEAQDIQITNMADGGGSNDWCTIESDPGVFTELLETLGCENVQLEELYTLEDDSLQMLRDSTNNQVYGLIFLFQWQSHIQKQHAEDATAARNAAAAAGGDDMAMFDGTTGDLFFAHQVTTNACATQAILSVVLNADNIKLGNTLQEFKEFTKDFPPQLKGMSISSSEEIRTAHNSFGRSGEALFVDPERRNRYASSSDEVYHFVAYIPKHDKVYELDGLQQSPIEVGTIPTAAAAPGAGAGVTIDWLSVAREAIQKRMEKHGNEMIKFNLMAVCLDKRVPLQEVLKIDANNESAKYTLKMEEERRVQWKKENQRRKHNYVPFCIALLKELAKQKTTKTKNGGEEGKDGGETEEVPLLTHLYEQAKDRKRKQRSAMAANKKK